MKPTKKQIKAEYETAREVFSDTRDDIMEGGSDPYTIALPAQH